MKEQQDSVHLTEDLRGMRVTDLHAAIMNLPCKPGLAAANATDNQLIFYKLGHRDARHAAAELAAADAAGKTELLEALKAMVRHADRESCRHEETYRGGAIWTICRQCDMKWADDRGGFKPYQDPKEVAAARALIAKHSDTPS